MLKNWKKQKMEPSWVGGKKKGGGGGEVEVIMY